MKILYLIPNLATSGGMERVLTEKVNYLSNLDGFNITIVTTDMMENEVPFFQLSGHVNLVRLSLNYKNIFGLNFFSKIEKTISLNKIYKKKIADIVSEHEIDICISMGGKELEFLGDLKLPCKTIYELHFNKDFRSSFLKANNKKNLIWKFWGWMRDYQHIHQAKKFDQLVVLTDVNLIAWQGEVNSVIKIVNPSPLSNPSNEKPLLSRKRAIAIGKLDRQKGFDLLIEAWDIVHKNRPEWKLDIYGVGELESQLKNKIKSLNLQSIIELKGLLHNVKYEMNQSAFYLLSSRFEGLPMVLIESITCGLPIVAFDCPTGPREIINNNDCGVLIKNGDVNALANGIIYMIDNPNLLYEMSDNALAKSKNYHIDNIMNQWIKLFNQLLSKKI